MPNILIPEKLKVIVPEKEGMSERNMGDSTTFLYISNKGKPMRFEKGKPFNLDDVADKKIIDIDNTPTKGFSLVRYPNEERRIGLMSPCADAYLKDPRGFIAHIGPKNFMYIVHNMGENKKIEDIEMVYAWTDNYCPMLMPIMSADYEDAAEYSGLLYCRDRITAKKLIVGARYLTEGNEEWIYIGKLPYYEYRLYFTDAEGKRYDPAAKPPKGVTILSKTELAAVDERYYFGIPWTSGNGDVHWYYTVYKNVGRRLTKCLDPAKTPDYDSIYDGLIHDVCLFPKDDAKADIVPYSFEEFSYACKLIKAGDPRIEGKKFRSRNSAFDSTDRIIIKYNDAAGAWDVYAVHSGSRSKVNMIDNVEELYHWVQPAYKQEYLASGAAAMAEHFTPETYPEA